jgi:hypothetical protein
MLAHQLDEARHVNAEAWSFKASQHDVTSGRILFTRIALCWLRNVDASHYLGQLRTLLAQPELPCLGGIDRQFAAADRCRSEGTSSKRSKLSRQFPLGRNQRGPKASSARLDLHVAHQHQPVLGLAQHDFIDLLQI